MHRLELTMPIEEYPFRHFLTPKRPVQSVELAAFEASWSYRHGHLRFFPVTKF